MTVVWLILLFVFLLCFTIYQWWFEQSRTRNMSELRKGKIKFYNRPAAWATYSVILFFAILILISVQVLGLMEALMELNQ